MPDEDPNIEESQAETEATPEAAAEAEDSVDTAAVEAEASAEPGESLAFEDFADEAEQSQPAELDLLGDVQLDVTIELGRTRMLVEDVLRLSSGAVVELDKLAGDPVDVYVNERLVARGEVLVMNDNFSIRVNEILDISAIEEADRKSRPTGTDG